MRNCYLQKKKNKKPKKPKHIPKQYPQTASKAIMRHKTCRAQNYLPMTTLSDRSVQATANAKKYWI